MDISGGGISVDNSTLELNTSGQAKISANYQAYISALLENNIKQAVKILFLEVAASVSSQDYTDLFADVFSDSNGNKNTIDTGNTTATFGSSEYVNTDGSSDSANNHGVNMTLNSSETTPYGFKITMGGSNKNLKSVTKHANTTATQCRLENASHSLIATATFSGDTATFSPVQALTASTSYYITTISESHNVQKLSSGVSYPINTTDCSFVTGYNGGDAAGAIYAFTGITFEGSSTYATKIIQSSVIATPSDNISGVMVIADGDVTGITASVSANGGTNWTTGAIGEVITPTVTGKSLKVRIYLNGNTCIAAQGYGVALWTA